MKNRAETMRREVAEFRRFVAENKLFPPRRPRHPDTTKEAEMAVPMRKQDPSDPTPSPAPLCADALREQAKTLRLWVRHKDPLCDLEALRPFPQLLRKLAFYCVERRVMGPMGNEGTRAAVEALEVLRGGLQYPPGSEQESRARASVCDAIPSNNRLALNSAWWVLRFATSDDPVAAARNALREMCMATQLKELRYSKERSFRLYARGLVEEEAERLLELAQEAEKEPKSRLDPPSYHRDGYGAPHYTQEHTFTDGAGPALPQEEEKPDRTEQDSPPEGRPTPGIELLRQVAQDPGPYLSDLKRLEKHPRVLRRFVVSCVERVWIESPEEFRTSREAQDSLARIRDLVEATDPDVIGALCAFVRARDLGRWGDHPKGPWRVLLSAAHWDPCSAAREASFGERLFRGNSAKVFGDQVEALRAIAENEARRLKKEAAAEPPPSLEEIYEAVSQAVHEVYNTHTHTPIPSASAPAGPPVVLNVDSSITGEQFDGFVTSFREEMDRLLERKQEAFERELLETVAGASFCIHPPGLDAIQAQLDAIQADQQATADLVVETLCALQNDLAQANKYGHEIAWKCAGNQGMIRGLLKSQLKQEAAAKQEQDPPQDPQPDQGEGSDTPAGSSDTDAQMNKNLDINFSLTRSNALQTKGKSGLSLFFAALSVLALLWIIWLVT